MPTYDASYHFRNSLPDPPKGVSRAQVANQIRNLVNLYNAMITPELEMHVRGSAAAVHRAIHELDRLYAVSRYMPHSEFQGLKDWAPIYALWMADNPKDYFKNQNGLYDLSVIKRKMWRLLIILNPLRQSVKEIVRTTGIVDTPANVRNKRSQNHAKYKGLNVFTLAQGGGLVLDDYEVRVKGREGKAWAPSQHPTTGQYYYETEEAQRRNLIGNPFYIYHSAAWGMRLYAAALREMHLDCCPLIPYITVEWLEYENKPGKPQLRPLIMAKADAEYLKNPASLAYVLPYYEQHPDKWMLKFVVDDYRRGAASRAVTAGKLKELLDREIKRYGRVDIPDDMPMPPDPRLIHAPIVVLGPNDAIEETEALIDSVPETPQPLNTTDDEGEPVELDADEYDLDDLDERIETL